MNFDRFSLLSKQANSLTSAAEISFGKILVKETNLHFLILKYTAEIIKEYVVRLFDRFYRINPNAVKSNPFGVRLPAADIFASIEELKVSSQFP